MVEEDGTNVWFFERKYVKNSSRTREEVQLLAILVVDKRKEREAMRGDDNRIQDFQALQPVRVNLTSAHCRSDYRASAHGTNRTALFPAQESTRVGQGQSIQIHFYLVRHIYCIP